MAIRKKIGNSNSNIPISNNQKIKFPGIQVICCKLVKLLKSIGVNCLACMVINIYDKQYLPLLKGRNGPLRLFPVEYAQHHLFSSLYLHNQEKKCQRDYYLTVFTLESTSLSEIQTHLPMVMNPRTIITSLTCLGIPYPRIMNQMIANLPLSASLYLSQGHNPMHPYAQLVHQPEQQRRDSNMPLSSYVFSILPEFDGPPCHLFWWCFLYHVLSYQ